MEITPRQQAIMERKKRYFTGVPCKNGHIAERYTKCSVCVECLHPTFESRSATAVSEDPWFRLRDERTAAVAERLEARQRNTLARFRMQRIKVVLHDEDLAPFVEMAAYLAIAREPTLSRADVFTKFEPRPRGERMAMYAFKAFSEDAPALHKLAEDLRFPRLSPHLQQLIMEAESRRIG